MFVSSQSTVFIVDDDDAVRESLEWLITSENMNVQSYSSAQEFLSAYDPGQSGCLVLDVRMPGMSGLELQERLKKNELKIPIIIMTAYGDVPSAVRAMRDGAVDYVEKPFNGQYLVERIRIALDQDVKNRAKYARQAKSSALLSLLTCRENQVVDLIVMGHSNKKIAEELGISHKTVEAHRAHIMQKLEVNGLAQLMRLVLNT